MGEFSTAAMAQEALMSVQFLNPAMGRLTVEGSPVVWKTSALGTPASTSYLGLNFAGAPTTAQVFIRWKYILIDIVQQLGGTEPAYVREESMDAKFQVRVSFRLPLDNRAVKWEELTVIGTKCSSFYEAESEASAAALQVLQHGRLRICVKDVSLTRCVELEKRCSEILVNASHIYDGAKALLSSWEDNMDKAEFCYSPARPIAGQSTYHGRHRPHGDLRRDLAEKLANIIRAYYLKLKNLDHETEKVKIYMEHVCGRVRDHFCSPFIHQANQYRGSLPQEIELRMQLILQEMMISIGWEWPSYNVISTGMSCYVCETTLSPNRMHAGPVVKPLTITGAEALSKEEAIESSCKAAILLLENERSICLVDLNYNQRSHGELIVVEAKEAVQSASVMGSKIITEWEAMLDEIAACKNYCQMLLLDHPDEEQVKLMDRMSCSSTKAVAGLHEALLADLQLAKHRFNDAA